MNQPFHEALKAAQLGYFVQQKAPNSKPTKDIAAMRAMHAANPNANWGIRAERRFGIVALSFSKALDIRFIENDFGVSLPRTVTILRSSRGGCYKLFAASDADPEFAPVRFPGTNAEIVRAVPLPGSPDPRGGIVRWETGASIHELPMGSLPLKLIEAFPRVGPSSWLADFEPFKA